MTQCEARVSLLSDAELVVSTLNGHTNAFDVLVARYERAVLATALPVVRDCEIARDVAQETFLTAYKKLRSLREPAGFGRWLLRIARNQALSFTRVRLKLPTSMTIDESCSTTNERSFDDESERLLAAVGRLPEGERTVIMMRFFDGLSVQEIAGASGRPVGTVTKQLSRAYERLRSFLE